MSTAAFGFCRTTLGGIVVDATSGCAVLLGFSTRDCFIGTAFPAHLRHDSGFDTLVGALQSSRLGATHAVLPLIRTDASVVWVDLHVVLRPSSWLGHLGDAAQIEMILFELEPRAVAETRRDDFSVR